MSKKIKDPNAKNSGFTIGIIALVVIVIAVIAAVFYFGQKQDEEVMPGEDVDFSVSADDGVITLAKNGAKDATIADIYEDYSCHYCADMSAGGHADELAALNAGDIVVKHHPLNFLDNGQEGHSTRALAVLQRIAETGNARLYWNFHTLLMEQQQEAYRWEWSDFASRLEAMGAPSELVNEVDEGLDLAGAKKVGAANAKDLTSQLDTDKPSSPHVLVNGKDVTPKQGEQLGDWVNKVLDTGK